MCTTILYTHPQYVPRAPVMASQQVLSSTMLNSSSCRTLACCPPSEVVPHPVTQARPQNMIKNSHPHLVQLTCFPLIISPMRRQTCGYVYSGVHWSIHLEQGILKCVGVTHLVPQFVHNVSLLKIELMDTDNIFSKYSVEDATLWGTTLPSPG